MKEPREGLFVWGVTSVVLAATNFLALSILNALTRNLPLHGQ
jgi:hypothetical protein